MQKHINLKLDRKLIDPNFNGYKLSLDSMPTYQLSLDEDVDVTHLSDDQYSYQHLKAFGTHNYLFIDPWTPDYVWIVDKHWHIYRAGMSVDTHRLSVTRCYEIPEVSNRRLTPGRVNVSLSFLSSHEVVLTDGTGQMYILSTGNRSHDTCWKELYVGQPLGADVKFSVLHSIQYSKDQLEYCDVVCVSVENSPESENSNFITKLHWLTLTSDNSTSFCLSRTRTLECGVCPEYVAVDPVGSSLVLTCEKYVKFVYDSLKPVVELSDVNGKGEDSENKPAAYTWTQKEGELTVRFEFNDPVCRSDVSVTLKSNEIDVRLSYGDNVQVLLIGNTAATIDIENSTWTLLEGKVLELNLFKAVPQRWDFVVEGDKRGEEQFDPEKIALINEQLAAYTSETVNPAPADDERMKTFNTQQLEECDAMPEDDLCIYCWDGESHQLIYQVNISGNQWLFTSGPPNPDEYPVICLRHDVDGIIWQPSYSADGTFGKSDSAANSFVAENSCGSVDWHHVATFNAFGYVQASKQQKRFIVCSQNFSYVALADNVRHVYVYKQPENIVSPIRNRKTGETVGAVAKQQLVSLESTEDIVGVQATRKHLFVVSGKTLTAVTVYE